MIEDRGPQTLLRSCDEYYLKLLQFFFFSSVTGMSKTKGLLLSKVVHKAFVKVNEEGSEAAAATSFYVECLCYSRNVAYFMADHPYLFVIRHLQCSLCWPILLPCVSTMSFRAVTLNMWRVTFNAATVKDFRLQ